MGPDTPYVMEPWGISPQGGLLSYGVKDAGIIRHGVVLPTPGRGYAGDRDGDNQELHHFPSEQNFPIYRNSSYIEDVTGGGASPRVMVPNDVMVTGGTVLGGRAVGGEVGGDGDRGGRGVRGGGLS